MLSRTVTLDAASAWRAKSFEASTINQVTQVSHSWLGKGTFLLSHHWCQVAETTHSFLPPPSAHSTNLPGSKFREPKASAPPVPSPFPRFPEAAVLLLRSHPHQLEAKPAAGRGSQEDEEEVNSLQHWWNRQQTGRRQTENAPWWEREGEKKKPLPTHTDLCSATARKAWRKKRELCLSTYFILSSTGTTKKKSKSGESTRLETGKYHWVKSRRKKYHEQPPWVLLPQSSNVPFNPAVPKENTSRLLMSLRAEAEEGMPQATRFLTGTATRLIPSHYLMVMLGYLVLSLRDPRLGIFWTS